MNHRAGLTAIMYFLGYIAGFLLIIGIAGAMGASPGFTALLSLLWMIGAPLYSLEATREKWQ